MGLDMSSVLAVGLIGYGVWYYYNKQNGSSPDTASNLLFQKDIIATMGLSNEQTLKELCSGNLDLKQQGLAFLEASGEATTDGEYQQVLNMSDAEYDTLIRRMKRDNYCTNA